jgi:glutathione synthase/RimK-type ligase-like ATP-grasp enzyme
VASLRPIVLVAGGDRDPNLISLIATLGRAAIETIGLLNTVEQSPGLSWDLKNDELRLDGEVINPTAAFIRHDVFTSTTTNSENANYRAFAWYTTVAGWLAAHPGVRCLNRGVLHTQLNKPHVLHCARDVGLNIPETLVSNELNNEKIPHMGKGQIVKPVTGGGYCQPFPALEKSTELRKGVAAAPAIIQNELVAPEIRLYRVGERVVPYRVISDELDYRTTQQTRVEPMLEALPADVLSGLARLMEHFGLDFGAADFKTDRETGELVFLEINTSPMFAAFDRVSDQAVSQVLVNELTRWG